MRKPSQYLPAALAKLRSHLLPDCAVTMRCGEVSAAVTRTSSHSIGGSTLGADGPSECFRILAAAADFPMLRVGSPVELTEADARATFRVVVSLTSDPSGATKYAGLSHAFNEHMAAYTGTRAHGQTVRGISLPLPVLVMENGTSDPRSFAVAPSGEEMYTVAIRKSDWSEETPPEPSDVMKIEAEGLVLKISTVASADGWYMLNCRARG